MAASVYKRRRPRPGGRRHRLDAKLRLRDEACWQINKLTREIHRKVA